MKKIAVLLAMLLAVCLMSGCGNGAETSAGEPAAPSTPDAASPADDDAAPDGEVAMDYTGEWKFAHNESERGTMHIYAEEFKRLVEEKSGGSISVTIYPDGTLGAGDSIIELLQGGGLEFALADSGYIGSFVPESQLFRVHYLLSDDTQINRQLLKGEAMELLNEKFAQNDMKVMHHFQQGFTHWTGNRAFRSVDDFKGIKMRTVPTPILIDTYKAYGANPTTINYSELYSSLQLGVVEAQENPISTVEELSLYEVQTTLTLSSHYAFIATAVVNPMFYDGLPAEVQQMLGTVFTELDDYMDKEIERYEAELLTGIAAHDMEIVELTAEETAALRTFNEGNREILRPSLGESGMEILEKLESEKAALE